MRLDRLLVGACIAASQILTWLAALAPRRKHDRNSA